MSNPILQIKDLSLFFGGLKAVDELSFNVPEGEIVALIGPNGAGKTTVFNCVTRFYDHYTGDIIYYNNSGEAINLRDYEVTDVIYQGIARTFQNIELIPDLSIIDNVLIGAHKEIKSSVFEHIFKSPRMVKQEKVLYHRAEEILNFLNIGMIKDMYAFGLPYGILKKIELARALIAKPRLLILDEPAAGLNEQETDELAKIIRKLKSEWNMTILLIEHDMSFVMNISDHVCAISFGKFLAYDIPESIKSNPLVQEAYLGKDE
ncbi:ABC transporter ATP-binding protein [Hujiaoplasma nucleasis]|uniref:ABC transporter ATP-binding protein n=1 Tax=Hujiaoplasma nucleasis TaxID=2725268 RepID=A0A7L6N1Q2_9MOLU|nr:ABC transporter ATP-binding protein [Hujiaoplasma nucleasis]QLY40093.1 ABC transporter ATP-binding protein [Hujiaoplasma nucleasis]